MRPRRTFRPRRRREPYRINELITAQEIRLVGNNVEQGLFKIEDALRQAKEQDLDLVEISPKVDPPVCKIIDYRKFLFEKKKKEKEIKAKTSKTQLKEIRFTPNTDQHDFDFKFRHAEKFLKEGAKVKAYVQFRGRNIIYKERGELMLLKFVEQLVELGALEAMPKLEGRRMFVIISPKSGKKSSKKADKTT